jgi:glycosyltransferase involved in cell wall biosynthesis
MRIGLDGYPLSEPRTGVGHYTFELARALALAYPSDQFELISPKPFDESVAREAVANLSFIKGKSSSIRGHWWSVGLPLYAKRSGLDLFHGTNFELPLWSRRRAVLTIHDLSALNYPELHRPRLARRARVRLPLAAKLARAIITPTEAVKQEVCSRFRLKSEKVTAIHEAPRSVFRPLPPDETFEIRKRLEIEDDFLLFVGTLEPRKNLLTLLKAFDQILRHTSWRPQLVVAGGEGWLMDETFSFLKESGINERLRLAGYLNDEELRALYSSCKAFIYPSLYEGFGLPPLEAMACGAPVVASRIPALQETLGDAATLIEPVDVDGLAKAIKNILEDEGRRQTMSSIGLNHVAQFSWEKAATLTYEIYRQVFQRRVQPLESIQLDPGW